MSDDLRTRIAAAISGYIDRHMQEDFTYGDAADAVIRELGSDCIYRYACHRCGDFWFDKSERMQRFALLHGKAHNDE